MLQLHPDCWAATPQQSSYQATPVHGKPTSINADSVMRGMHALNAYGTYPHSPTTNFRPHKPCCSSTSRVVIAHEHHDISSCREQALQPVDSCCISHHSVGKAGINTTCMEPRTAHTCLPTGWSAPWCIDNTVNNDMVLMLDAMCLAQCVVH